MNALKISSRRPIAHFGKPVLICSELVTDICGQPELLRNLWVLREFCSKYQEVWTDSHPFPGKASATKEFISPPFLAAAMEKSLRQNKEACRPWKGLQLACAETSTQVRGKWVCRSTQEHRALKGSVPRKSFYISTYVPLYSHIISHCVTEPSLT